MPDPIQSMNFQMMDVMVSIMKDLSKGTELEGQMNALHEVYEQYYTRMELEFNPNLKGL